MDSTHKIKKVFKAYTREKKESIYNMKRVIKSQENKRGRKKTYKNKYKTNKMAISTYISVINLNVNKSSAPTKRHTVVERTKIKPHICYLQENHFKTRDTYRLKVRRWKTIFHAKGNQRWNNTHIRKK